MLRILTGQQCVDIFKDETAKHKIDSISFTLQYVDHSHNGLFKYRCEMDDTASNPLFGVNEETGRDFPCDVYNKIKEFYHKHNFHKIDDGDSMIKPFVSAVNVDIHGRDNDALKHYLSQYEIKFYNELKFVQIQYDSLIERSWLKNFTMLMFGRGKHHSFYRLSTRMKGDKAYYNSLLYSCYNTTSDLSPVKNEAELNVASKAARRKIFNVFNCLECMNVMEERINNRFSIQTSVISFWVAVFAILLSVLFYIFSLNNEENSNSIMLLLLDIWSKMR